MWNGGGVKQAGAQQVLATEMEEMLEVEVEKLDVAVGVEK